jgi:hypothetical protein
VDVIDAEQAKVDKVEQKQRLKSLRLMWLWTIHFLKSLTNSVDSITEDKVCENNREAHKVNAARIPHPITVVEVVDSEHTDINPACNLSQEPFEVLKKWWVVERPLVSRVVVPRAHWDLPRQRHPVSMHFEVS